MSEQFYDKLIRSIYLLNKSDYFNILKGMNNYKEIKFRFSKLEKNTPGIIIGPISKEGNIQNTFLKVAKEVFVAQEDKREYLEIIEGLESGIDEEKLELVFNPIQEKILKLEDQTKEKEQAEAEKKEAKKKEAEQKKAEKKEALKIKAEEDAKNIEKKRKAEEEAKQIEKEKKQEEMIKGIIKEKKMYTYFGYMDIDNYTTYNSIYNFYPLYELIEGKFVEIKQPKSRFPDYGNFAIFFDRYNYDIFNKFEKGEYCIIELLEEDIELNRKQDGSIGRSREKIQIDKLDKAGKIHKLSDYGLYPVVGALSGEVDLTKDKFIDLDSCFPIKTYVTEAVLYNKGYYYGPFKITFRAQDGRAVLLNNTKNNNYICKRYNALDVDDVNNFYCNPKGYDLSPIELVSLKGEEVEFDEIDLLDTDEKLLNDYQSFYASESSLEENKSNYFSRIGNEVIAQRRFSRLQEIISNQENYENYQFQISNLIKSQILDDPDSDISNILIGKLSEDKDFLNSIQGYAIIQNKIKELKDDLSELEKDKLKQKKEASISKEVEKKQEELKQIQAEIDSISDDYRKAKLINSIENLESEHDNATRRWIKLESEIEEKTNKAVDRGSQLIFDEQFDKILYQKMTDAISKFESEGEMKKYLSAKENLSVQSLNELEGEVLIDYIVEEVKKYRPKYDRNTIVNILICMSQGLLTIFSGKPGTGKTSICKIVSHVLGLDNPKCTYEGIGKRFVNVHVERGWNSKRDLIGYYNPLSRKIEKNNIDLYNSFKVLDLETRDNTASLPMVVLLDEANLSPMEFYWADFVGICDDFDIAENAINLGDQEQILIPRTLRFLATINNDHTTETISPRLIDRAFVISLENKSSREDTDNFENTYNEPVELTKLIDALNKDSSWTEEQDTIYGFFEKNFERVNQNLSPRVKNAVMKYCSCADLFETNNIDNSIIALDYALSQKVITKVQGNGDKYLEMLNNLKDYCKEKNLPMTKNRIEKIINNSEMQYYQFFD